MPKKTILEISIEEQAKMLSELRAGRYGYLLGLHILLLCAAGKTPTADCCCFILFTFIGLSDSDCLSKRRIQSMLARSRADHVFLVFTTQLAIKACQFVEAVSTSIWLVSDSLELFDTCVATESRERVVCFA